MVKLLTWNIQAGIRTGRYRDYLLRAHRQVMHTASKMATLEEIAREIAPYDLVCLQEVDLGGRRAAYRSQVDAIAQLSGHDFVAVQENRVIPGVSRHGNAILSRWALRDVQDIKLPGRISGRGCLVVDVEAQIPLRIACLHLSLGAMDQKLQLAAVASALSGAHAWAAIGDFNCVANGAPMLEFCRITGGRVPSPTPMTFPAWRPRRDYDHMVAGGRLSLSHYQSENLVLSDHLPVTAKATVRSHAD